DNRWTVSGLGPNCCCSYRFAPTALRDRGHKVVEGNGLLRSIPLVQSNLNLASNSSSFMGAKSYLGYTSLARLKKNSSKAWRARVRSGSMTRPKAILAKNRSAPETGTSSKWFGNIRDQYETR